MHVRLIALLTFPLATLRFVAPGALLAQRPDSTTAQRVEFEGRVISSVDSTPVRSADVRLFFIDSARAAAAQKDQPLDMFIDSLRSRLGSTDSLGRFAIHSLAPGKYLVRMRRMGYQPIEGLIVADSTDLGGDVVMTQTSQMLAAVKITEGRVDVVREKLKRMGFEDRSNMGLAANFIDRKEILKRKPRSIEDLLSPYGIHEGDFLLDRMPLSFQDIRNYPAELVIAVEIYRHGRPTEFNMLRSGGGVMDSPNSASAKPLTVIWTYIPGATGR